MPTPPPITTSIRKTTRNLEDRSPFESCSTISIEEDQKEDTITLVLDIRGSSFGTATIDMLDRTTLISIYETIGAHLNIP